MEIISKGWGHEKVIHNSGGYCGKILCFRKGGKCSYHYHAIKDEHFYCVGKIILRYGWTDDIALTERVVLSTGDDFHIPVGMRHQMEALEDSELFEFSTTDYADDSIRIVPGD
jgi:mannose-6-phosphate isomerase-like protein (cupin superfamily)